MKFQVFKTKGEVNQDGFTYGIRAVEKEKTVASVPDISTDISVVQNMSELFNKYELSPIHLKDAIEDLLVK